MTNMKFNLSTNVIFSIAIISCSACLSAESKWEKKTIEDKFTQKKTTYALIDSNETQPVGITAQPVDAHLIIFKPNGKKNYPAKIRFSENSIPLVFMGGGGPECPAGPCVVQVKFDGGSILEYEFYKVDYSKPQHEIFCCFEGGRNDFSAIATRSKKIEIRVNFYQRGYGDFSFSPNSALNWD